MPSPQDQAIDDLAAPLSDGQLLIWPDPSSLKGLAAANRARRLRQKLLLLGRPASEWSTAPNDDLLRLMAGHQPDFFHPGVWLKAVAAEFLGEASGGLACFLLVDSDVPGQIRIEWPEENRVSLEKRVRSIASGEIPFEALGPRQTGQIITVLDELGPPASETAIPDQIRSAMSSTPLPQFSSGFKAARSPGYVDRWTTGYAAANDYLGLRNPEFMQVSRLFDFAGSDHSTASAFVAHLLLQAEAFAACYNRAIAGYRQARGIRGTRHPIPDLETGPDRIELPFWFVEPGRPRRRLFVTSAGPDAVGLCADEAAAGIVDRGELSRRPGTAVAKACAGWQIRPRALAQTMFARLTLCDLFIHGIGGAKYDQITDQIIRSFFNLDPPAFACVSATLWLPLPRFDAAEEDLARLRRLTRDLQYNPQRHLTDVALSPTFRACLDERAAAIRDAERCRAESPRDRAARRAAFDRIRHANARLLAILPTRLRNDEGQIQELERRIRHDRIAEYREWFFALYPAEKLRHLAESLKRALQ